MTIATDPDGYDCCYCPQRRFPSRTALDEHIEHDCVVHAAERTAHPRDPLAVLREALVWAIDEGALRLATDDLALVDVATLAPSKSIPGYAAVLRHNAGNATARVALTIDGRALSVMVVRTGPPSAMRLRVQLPAQFVVARAEERQAA